jgi:hypothetical protein
MVPQPFAARGNQSCPKFWAITGDPRYPGYEIEHISAHQNATESQGISNS